MTAVRAGWIHGTLANYIAHAWMAALALTWFFALRRRFPIGAFDHRQLRPWYVLSLVAIVINLGATIASPPVAGLPLPNLPTLAAQLVFLALVVGPTEELLFRGLIQSSLNASIHANVSIRSWRLGWGTLIASVLFGLFHLVNLGYQALGPTLQQVLTAIFIGLVIGVLYERTRNLIGASLVHSLLDFSGPALALLASAMVHR